MQFSHSLFTLVLVGSLVSLPIKSHADVSISLSENTKRALAAAAFIGAAYIYNRTPSTNLNKNVVTQAVDVATVASHKATTFAGKWASTAAFASLFGWAAYHNTNIDKTVLVNFIKSLPKAS